jgi:hypothetical protein
MARQLHWHAYVLVTDPSDEPGAAGGQRQELADPGKSPPAAIELAPLAM